MLSLTESAAAQLMRLHAEQDDPEFRLRIFVDAGGCSGFEYGMAFAVKKEGDHEFEDKGVTYYMDTASLDYMKGSVVEFDDSLHGKGFQITNPNATNTCGCGRSFN
ncbi:MAG: iron-sulfur cluster assembly accessory protein [Verrucomicrobia bacterium]|nr:iron-sulfur cluster assembly accessory protein [Verrucomicrobiota bacterium]